MGIIRRKIIDWLGHEISEGEPVPASAQRLSEDYEACCWMEVARSVMASYVAAALQRSEIRFKPSGEQSRDADAFAWNVSPNPAQTHSEMMSKLVSKLLLSPKGEALVVPVPRRGRLGGKDIYVADSWSADRRPGRATIYSNISIEGSTEVVRGTLDSTQLYRFTVDGDSGWSRLMQRLDRQYSKLAASAMAAMEDRNAQRWVFRLSQSINGTGPQVELTAAYIKKQLREFVNHGRGVLPLYEGMSLERVSTDATKRGSDPSADVTGVRKDMFETAAQCFRMPVSLLYGNTNNFDSVLASFLTFAVDPVARLLEEEITRKTYTQQQWSDGSTVEVDTSHIYHVDIFAVADEVEKLVGSRLVSVNELRGYVGLERIRQPWADEYVMTKNLGTFPQDGEQ